MDEQTNDDLEAQKAARQAKRQAINAEVKALQRGCFSDLLVDYLDCAPDRDSIELFAKRYPDRYFVAMQAIASLAGYKKDVNINHNHNHLIGTMPDSELYKQLGISEQALRLNVTMKQIPMGNGDTGLNKKSSLASPAYPSIQPGNIDTVTDMHDVPKQQQSDAGEQSLPSINDDPTGG